MKAKNQTPSNASALLAANLGNLKKRVLKGKPLTLEEVRILQSMEGKKAPEAPNPHFAKNQSELADVLGVSRQLIAYHCKRRGNPGRRDDGRYPVRVWRDYMVALGRVELAGSKRPPNGGSRLDCGEGVFLALWQIGESLPTILRRALVEADIEATPSQIDSASVLLFFLQFTLANVAVMRWGFPSLFDANEDGTADWPEAIRAAATRSIASETPATETASIAAT